VARRPLSGEHEGRKLFRTSSADLVPCLHQDGPNGYKVTQAYHTLDWNAVCENWATFQGGVPQPSDTALSSQLQEVWREFMYTGRVSFSGWQPIDGVPGFPAHTGTFVFGTTAKPPGVPSGFVTDYRASQCALLAAHGFDARFWWCN
jgi:hypothetical protein